MRRVLSDQEIARMRAVGTYAFNHDATEQDRPTPQDAEAVREEVWGRVRELQRNPHWSVAINRVDAALDAYREAVERRVRAEYEAWEPTVRRIAQTREPNLHELADLLRAATQDHHTGGE